VNETAAELKITEGVNGNDGTVGKLIECVGPYYISLGSISSMTKQRVEEQIRFFTRRIRTLEQATDSARVTKSVLEMRLRDLFVEEAKKYRGVKFKTPEGRTISMPRNITPRNAEQATRKTLATAAGITEDEMNLVLEMLKKRREQREGGNATVI
jgi:hypothetical protein